MKRVLTLKMQASNSIWGFEMKILPTCQALIVVFLFTPTKAFAISKDVVSWPKSDAAQFGCFLEQKFRHKDKKFNCSLKKYLNIGDPCQNTEAYYEGPKFPDRLAKKVHPAIHSIELSWERGMLQSVSITMNQRMSSADIFKALKLPGAKAKLPTNIQSIDVQECAKTASCAIITGFEHLGAGDVDCGSN